MRLFTVTALALAAVAAAAPVSADHTTTPSAVAGEAGTLPPATTTGGSVDIDVKLGLNGFRFGSRLFGRGGYAGGAWLNGETRRDGFSLDGRVERDGKAWNFKMNADVDEWLRRAGRWWGFTNL